MLLNKLKRAIPRFHNDRHRLVVQQYHLWFSLDRQPNAPRWIIENENVLAQSAEENTRFIKFLENRDIQTEQNAQSEKKWNDTGDTDT